MREKLKKNFKAASLLMTYNKNSNHSNLNTTNTKNTENNSLPNLNLSVLFNQDTRQILKNNK